MNNKESINALTDEMLESYAGGSTIADLTRMKVKCPVEGCNYECNTFGEMNVHMHTHHPEPC